MKAPDKIYVEVCEDGIFAFLKPPFEESVAYIRADLVKQPVLPGIDEEGIPGRDFIPVDWVDACEKYGKWKIVRAEQPANEGPEEAARHWILSHNDGDVLYVKDAFIAGAEWQKIQDQNTIELAEEHAMLAGMNKMEQQMLEEAIHYVVQDDLDPHGASYNIPFIRIEENALKPKGIGVGDKVRVIIIKED